MAYEPPESGAGRPRTLRGDMQDGMRAGWLVPLVAGALNLIAALVVLIEPHGSLTAITVVLGIYLVIAGIIVVTSATAADPNRLFAVILGVLAVIAGIFVILHPGSAITTVRIVFGIYLLITGIVRLLAARREQRDRFTDVLPGVLSVIAGLVFLFAPKLGLSALALFVGVYLLIRAAVDLAVAWELHRQAGRRDRHSGPRSAPTPGREARH